MELLPTPVIFLFLSHIRPIHSSTLSCASVLIKSISRLTLIGSMYMRSKA